MSTDIATPGSALPALYQPAPLEIDSSDIALPRLYVGTGSSKAVESELVKRGDIYHADNGDDQDPVVLFSTGGKKGVLVHVLSLTKGRSATIDGELKRFEFNDADAPADSWVTYNYLLCLPEVDEDVPFKLTLTKSGTGTAKKINTVLKKGAARGPAHAHAFRLTTSPRKNDKGAWHIFEAKPADATAEGIAIAESMVGMISGSAIEQQAPAGTEPAI